MQKKELLIQIGCGIFEPHTSHPFSEFHYISSPAGEVAKAGCSGQWSRKRSPDHCANDMAD